MFPQAAREGKSRTIEAAPLAKKANLALGVAPDESDNDGLLLPALETVDAAQLNAGKRLF